MTLRVRRAGSELRRVVEDVSGCDRDIESSVVVEIEEAHAESDERQRRKSDAALAGRVAEQAALETAVDAVHLEIEVGDDEVEHAVTVVVSGIDAHARTRLAVGS